MWGATIETEALDGRVVEHLCEALVAINVDYLRAAPHTPSLYAAGVRYEREPRGQEKWAAIPVVRARAAGDCEDLACWRVAELRVGGDVSARAVWRSQRTPRGWLYHVLVQHGDGQIEDPSRRLGM
ncbi:MAG: hypothetical protein R3B72_51910 [Polyangiaceae bacterium]